MIQNFAKVREFLSDSLPQRYLTGRLLRFAEEKEITRSLAAMGRFSITDVENLLQRKIGYRGGERVRLRMIRTLLDLLVECGYARREGALFVWNDHAVSFVPLTDTEADAVRAMFRGQVEFFERCIAHAEDFLSGGPPLCGFDTASLQLWEEFLGNDEFRFARSVLAKLLLVEKAESPRILDLCCGPGFDIQQIQEESLEASVVALDFKDIFHQKVMEKTTAPESVQCITSERWKGFGSPLPFPDNAFDKVFFSCADPYIPGELRDYVYRDIFRIVRRGGSLGILSHSYPDPAKEYVKDAWTRRGVLCHDFAESVCEGWEGFSDAAASRRLFETIGFSVDTIMLNASVWRLVKP